MHKEPFYTSGTFGNLGSPVFDLFLWSKFGRSMPNFHEKVYRSYPPAIASRYLAFSLEASGAIP